MICIKSSINFCFFIFGKRYRFRDLCDTIPYILNKLDSLRNAEI